MKIEKLTSYSQLKQKTNADVRQLGMIVSQRDEQTSTASQTVINLSFAVPLDIKQNFLLFIDGAGPLVETSDFTFTNVVNNTSAQVTLTSPVIAGLPIEAMLLGTQIAPFPNPSSVQAQLNSLLAIVSDIKAASNLIYNPEGYLFQRTGPSASTVNNDVYGPDRWNILCSADGVSIERSTDVPSRCYNSMKLSKATASGYFGMEQILEASESVPLRGRNIKWTLQAKTESSEVSQIRMSILGWESTADTVTSSIVSSWSAIPTYIGSVTQYGTTTLDLTNSYQEVELEATIGASCNNLIFFVHTTNSESVNDSIFITQNNAVESSFDMPYLRRSTQEEIARCQRYYSTSIRPGQTIYDFDGITPGVNAGVAEATGVNDLAMQIQYPVEMRINPVFKIYSAVNRTLGSIRRMTDGTDFTVSNYGSATGHTKGNTYMAGGSFTAGTIYTFQWTADAEL